jgi:hypothetical protein
MLQEFGMGIMYATFPVYMYVYSMSVPRVIAEFRIYKAERIQQIFDRHNSKS